MLPAHAYPELKKYPHLKGNLGTAWQNQQKEFATLPAPILFTTNCLMPPKSSYADRVFTTGSVQFPNTPYIKDENGHKDFTPLIKKALELGGYSSDQHFTGINGGTSVNTASSWHQKYQARSDTASISLQKCVKLPDRALCDCSNYNARSRLSRASE